jgi:hypothetical protein
VFEERRAVAKVLVGERVDGEFRGFWAEFEGEEVSSYKDTRGDNNIVYTLYSAHPHRFEAYRVHIADESDPKEPVYKLRPFSGELRPGSGRLNFAEAWTASDIVEEYPLFLKDMDYFETRHVDHVDPR